MDPRVAEQPAVAAAAVDLRALEVLVVVAAAVAAVGDDDAASAPSVFD